MRVVLIAVLLLVAACGAEVQGPAPLTTTSPVVDDDVGAAMGAVDTLLAACIPGVPGESGCTWASLSGAITELTAELRGAAAHPELAAALDGMDEAVSTFAPCAGWFDSDATTGDQLRCDAAWYDVTGAWAALKKAADWP
ncbi:MAG: hypothetical protein M3422_02300 [Actinomycetota bacterium]|nr:hypothetical protein [Actinomycetota bacterium]